MTIQREVIRKGRKFDEVLEGARRIFLRDGFEGASVDDIAKEAGVSKATLYSYFPDKRILFLEIVRDQCRIQSDAALAIDIESLPTEEVLRIAARIITEFVVSPMALSMHNLVHGEAGRFPELAREFYKSGPELGKQRLMMAFQIMVDRGDLEIGDLEFAAEQFAALCKADIWVKVCLCVVDTPTPEQIDKVINGAVETFLARYGAERG